MIPRLHRSLVSLAILSSLLVVALAASAAKPPVYKPPTKTPPRPAFVDDTVVLARVNDRIIRARDYVDRFFNAYIEFRPTGDSLGRVEFLQRLIDKEVIASVALASNYQETFEDRAVMKEHEQRILGNALFERAILDSVRVHEAEAETVYAQMKRELHLARIRFGTLETAQKMRRDLVAGRISWTRAWDLRVRLPGDASSSPDVGWHNRMNAPAEAAGGIFSLPVGGISQPIPEDPGFSLYKVIEERPLKGLHDYPLYRGRIIEELHSQKTFQVRERMMAGLRTTVGLRVDSANVAWVASRFPRTLSGEGSSRVTIDVTVPTFAPADTGRVVARYKGGQVTVGRLVESYRAISELLRPNLSTPEGVRAYLDALVLEPQLADIARRRGYDRDSTVIVQIERKREELRVERLFQDSILAKVFIPPAERRKYYKENQHRFVDAPSVRYAAFYVDSKGEADTLAARLRRGVPAQEVIRADSIAGKPRGQIFDRTRDDHNLTFPQVFDGGMKVGDVSFVGPNAEGGYNVIQLIARDWGRPVPFEVADRQIDEYMQGNAANKMLAAFTERHARQMKIESHPELLMRIRLDPPRMPSDIISGRGS